MKQINIAGKGSRGNPREVFLGNGYRKTFDSLREAALFTAETNRFLTECLVILNLAYSEAFSLYRDFWFIAVNNKSGTRTNYMTIEHKVKSLLSATDETFNKFNNSVYGSNDPYFAFIDLKKASLFLSEALAEIEHFNRKRKLTPAMYAAMVLRKRCLLVLQKLNTYPA